MLAILVVNLLAGEHGGNLIVHASVLGTYAIATALALGLAASRRGPMWIGTAFVVVDAMAVVALFHEHLYGFGAVEHMLTTSNLAIAFVLLNHAALRLRPSLVLLYAGLVTTGWLSLLVVRSAVERWYDPTALATLVADSTLAVAFAFAAFVAYSLVQDHSILLRSAVKSERRRLSLSRFFSPSVVRELQSDRVSTALQRQMAAVMFIDLRAFTRFAETASPQALAELLALYRKKVTDTVFHWGGTIDKFIGDGVMVVFGHPRPKPDDAERAVRCALELVRALRDWKAERQGDGRPALDAAIGLHLGQVVSGILESGEHDEFTVLGDAVNVAERLERLAKSLDASLVVSAQALARVSSVWTDIGWIWKDDVELKGRSGTLRIAYLQHAEIDEFAYRGGGEGPSHGKDAA